MKSIKTALLLCTLFSINACTVAPVTHIPTCDQSNKEYDCKKTPRKIVLFFDGTANDEGSYTNVSKLRNLITLQDKGNIRTIYIAGVGTGTRIIGAATGWGTTDDVKQGYKFLTKNYRSTSDEIYLFGFSRGSWSARILAGLVQVAGIPDLSSYSDSFSDKLINDIYRAYKVQLPLDKRRERVKEIIGKRIGNYQPSSVNIKFAGIWDSVEALGWPDYKENNEGPNRRYIEQLCNVNNVSHVLSIDDDRARIFTPILLTARETKKQCGYYSPPTSTLAKDHQIEILGTINSGDKRNVTQVFFSGAHSDVGGGYTDTDIDGISLNWMLSQIDDYDLVTAGTQVYADAYGNTHDPESGLAGLLYHRKNRNLSLYEALLDTKFKVHPSVIDRLECVPVDWHEYQWQQRSNLFRHCFTPEGGALKFNDDNPKCRITIVEDSRYNNKTCRYSTPKTQLSKLSTVTIHARKKKNNTGIILSKDHSYRFHFSEIKKWEDHGWCSNPCNGRDVFSPKYCSPPATDDGKSCFITKVFINASRLFSFEPKARLMELLGRIEGTKKPTPPNHKNKKSNLAIHRSSTEKPFRLGKMVENKSFFTPKESGELIVFVNEPKFSDTFYDNNTGTLQLTVELVE